MQPLIRLKRSDLTSFSGSAFDPADPDRRFVVELLLDHAPVVMLRAESAETMPALGDGRHGFHHSFSPGLLREHLSIQARIANGSGAGVSLVLAGTTPAEPSTAVAGEVALAGENVLRGWLQPGGAAPRAVFVVEGRCVASVFPDHFVHHDQPHVASTPGRFGFTAFLNSALPEPGFQRVHVFDDRGRELAGSPVLLHRAVDDLPERLLALDPVAARTAQLSFYRARFPSFLPFSAYETWRARAESTVPPATNTAHAVVLVGSGDVQSSLQSLEIGAGTTMVLAGTAPGAAVDLPSQALADALVATADLPPLVVLAPAGTRFSPKQLARVCAALAGSSAVLAYGDLDAETEDGLRPLFFPAFDYERLLEQGYCAHVFVVRSQDLTRVLASHGPTNLYDLFFRLLEDRGEGSVLHVPFPMARLPDLEPEQLVERLAAATRRHLGRRGVTAAVVARADAGPKTFPGVRVTRAIPPDASITVIIPTRDRSDLLRRCIETAVGAAESVRLDFVVVDNGSVERESFRLFDELRERGVRILRDERAFNYARLNNTAVASVDAEIICLLNNDVEFADPKTFGEMLGRLAEPDVGAVGVLMRRSSDVIQHGGVVLGPSYSATHAYVDHVVGSAGYMDALRTAHQTSAVTAACLLMRKRDFDRVGGLDEAAFPVAFNDVDLCLKLLKVGLRIIMTPHVVATHHESVSRGSDMTALRRPLFARELTNLRERWHRMLEDDPYYSPFLDRSAHPYSGLNCATVDPKPRERRFDLAMGTARSR